VIPNGVDIERFRPGPPDPALRQRLGLPADARIVLTVARLVPRKGHRVVIQALPAMMRKMPDVHYVFTGTSEAMTDELAGLAASLGIRDRVHCAGAVPAADLPALYRLAQA